MNKYESKICPRCHQPFSCRPDKGWTCDCAKIRLDQNQRDHIARVYDDCLCNACLSAMANEFDQQMLDAKLSLIDTIAKQR